MIFAREYVRSRLHGLGQVIESGDDPVVQFLDGRECEVPGETLTVVPEEVFASELENRMRLERWLTYRVYGIKERPTPMLRDGKFDLVTALQESLWVLPGRRSEPPPDEVPCFIVDDLARAAEGGRAGRADGRSVTKVIAIRSP